MNTSKTISDAFLQQQQTTTYFPKKNIFRDKTLEKSTIAVLFGLVINFFYYAGQYLHLLKSINRFCAIVFFIKYRKFFTIKLTTILISIAFFLSFLHITLYFSYNCNYYFDIYGYVWSTRGKCPLAFYLDIINCSITMFISFACDLATFCYLYFGLHKKSASLKQDIKFLVQAFLSSCFYLMTMFSFHVFPKFTSGTFMDFVNYTLAWMLCHALNQ